MENKEIDIKKVKKEKVVKKVGNKKTTNSFNEPEKKKTISTLLKDKKTKETTKKGTKISKKEVKKTTKKVDKKTTKTRKPSKNRLSRYVKGSRKLDQRINTLIKNDENIKEIYEDIKNGSNSFMRLDRIENTAYDMTWIKKIEDVIPAIDEIIRSPRINTKTIGNIVPIELARKTNSESIRHLSTHSQYVKDIDRVTGEVIPSKILNIEADDDYMIYENRFLATLIRRLVLFVEKRYDYIQKYSPLKDFEILYVKNKSVVDGLEVMIESKVIVSKTSTSPNELANTTEFVKRVRTVRKYVRYFYSSNFMKMFKHEKNVRSPILMTNIIRKNPRYHKCYELYRFIERYDKLGVNFTIDEKYLNVNDKNKESLYQLSLASLLALKGEEATLPLRDKKVSKSTRILKSMDDDVFTFFPTGEDPEFVRVDQEYLDYEKGDLDNLKKKPNSLLRKYEIGKYLKKGRLDKESKRRQELLERKKKELVQFEKDQKKLVKEQEKEKIRKENEKRKAYLNDERDQIASAREFIKTEALIDLDKDKQAIKLKNSNSAKKGAVSKKKSKISKDINEVKQDQVDIIEKKEN